MSQPNLIYCVCVSATKVMNEEKPRLLLKGSDLKDPWQKYRYVENQRPLEEYALNKPDGDCIECPISYEETPLDQTTLLTCCRKLISDVCYTQLHNNICPCCGNSRKTGYLFINNLMDKYKLFIAYDPSVDTVGMMKNRIRQLTGIMQSFKLTKEPCSYRRLNPDDCLLRELGVKNGQALYIW